MSWISIPLPNPFKTLHFSDDDEHEQEQDDPHHSSTAQYDAVSRGIAVKDDLSAIGKSIGRQLRGVAAFLAPPPPGLAADSSPAGDGDDGSSPSSKTLDGIRSDLAELGGSFRTSLSLFSTNSAVNGISKLASGLLQLNEEDNSNDNDGDNEGVGITDEVIEFASQISSRPELWTDFPLLLDQEFDMSEAQSEHASIIEEFVPSLADLRCRLSGNISDNLFWMIYFILLLPRFNEDDLQQLSTPEIVEARETLLLMLQSKSGVDVDSENPQSECSSDLDNKVDNTTMQKSQPMEEVISENSNVLRSTKSNNSDNTKKPINEDENRCSSSGDNNRSDAKADGSETNKASPGEGAVIVDNSNVTIEKHENMDNWLDENEPVATRTTHTALKPFQSEDEISFSDLEDDNDLPNTQSDSGPAQSTRASSLEGSNEWVQLNKNFGSKGSQLRGQSSSHDRDSDGEELNGWLTVDDFDP